MEERKEITEETALWVTRAAEREDWWNPVLEHVAQKLGLSLRASMKETAPEDRGIISYFIEPLCNNTGCPHAKAYCYAVNDAMRGICHNLMRNGARNGELHCSFGVIEELPSQDSGTTGSSVAHRILEDIRLQPHAPDRSSRMSYWRSAGRESEPDHELWHRVLQRIPARVPLRLLRLQFWGDLDPLYSGPPPSA